MVLMMGDRGRSSSSCPVLVVIGEKGRLSLSKLEEYEGVIFHDARSRKEWKVQRKDVGSQGARGVQVVDKRNEMGKTQGGYVE